LDLLLIDKLDSVDEYESADVCEDIVKKAGVLGSVKPEFDKNISIT